VDSYNNSILEKMSLGQHPTNNQILEGATLGYSISGVQK